MGGVVPMRARRGASVDHAQAALADARAARETLAEQIAAAHGRRHQLAEDAGAYEAGEAEVSRLQSEHRRLGLLVARHEAEVEEAQKAAARSAWEAVGKELKQAYGPGRSASEAVASALAALNHAVAALGDERERVKAAEDRFRALVPSDVDDWSYPPGRDEVAWGRLADDVVALVNAGARTPEADAAESTARQAAASFAAEAQRLPSVVQSIIRGQAGREALERTFLALNEDERGEVLRRAEASLVDVEEDIRCRYDLPNSVWPRTSDLANRDVEKTVGMIRGRIDRLRDLAEAVAA
jgi:hypothetical protein